MIVTYKDIKDKKEFNAEDSSFKMLEYCEESGRYLYGRYFLKSCRKEKIGTLMGYEVIIPVKHKNPDGTIVYSYPSSEQFGSKGWFFTPNDTERMRKCLRGEELKL